MPSDLAQLAYQCDAPEVTGYAGMPAFMKFAYGFGLADLLGDLPMPKRESIYAPGKLSEVVVAILAAGLERVSHIDDVKHDPGLCVALGLEQLPDQATLSRFFRDGNPAQVSWLRARNRAFSKRSVRLQERPQRMVVDMDTREVGVYGKQEGSKRSPRRDGDRMYTFEVATLRNSYDILDGGLLEGATHPAPRFRERMRDILDQLCRATEELVWCADAAWYAAHILQEIERADADEAIACRCRYAIRAQIRDGLDQAIAAIPEGQWRPCDEQLEIAELRYTFKEVRDHDGRKVKATLHWVSAAHAVAAEVRPYDHLFNRPDPGGDGDFLDDINPDSLEVIADAQLEPSIAAFEPGDRFQLERLGYFCVDPDSAEGHLVFNRTVALRDTWAKIQKSMKK